MKINKSGTPDPAEKMSSCAPANRRDSVRFATETSGRDRRPERAVPHPVMAQTGPREAPTWRVDSSPWYRGRNLSPTRHSLPGNSRRKSMKTNKSGTPYSTLKTYLCERIIETARRTRRTKRDSSVPLCDPNRVVETAALRMTAQRRSNGRTKADPSSLRDDLRSPAALARDDREQLVLMADSEVKDALRATAKKR